MKIDDIRLECADNGYILKWTEKTPSKDNELRNDIYNCKELVFTDDQKGDAIEKMSELKGMPNEKTENKEEKSEY